MKVSRIVASHVVLLAALMAGAEVQDASTPANQPTAMQNTTPPGTMGAKAQKAQDKEVKRQAKYNKKAAKNRVNATKDQEKAAKSRAKADKQQGNSDVDQAKAATNQQKATPQP